MKKIIFAIFIFTIAISSYAQQYDSESDFDVEREGNWIKITGYFGDKTEVNIPPRIQNLPVTNIGEGVFAFETSLTRVTIPDSVTDIGQWAFKNCTSLVSVNIPNNVNSIGLAAFSGCIRLTGVTIPNGITSIGVSVFSNCESLTVITIPDSVTSIGKGAFAICESLTNITIPNSVTNIGEEAFMYCTSLTEIIIPASVTDIGKGAFSWCNSLTSVTFSTGSNIKDANFGGYAFPEINFRGGDNLKTAYSTGKAGTYTRESGGLKWTKQ
ncbi:leucine-rich repeat domain-containing protein [Treponema sp. R6D11]